MPTLWSDFSSAQYIKNTNALFCVRNQKLPSSWNLPRTPFGTHKYDTSWLPLGNNWQPATTVAQHKESTGRKMIGRSATLLLVGLTLYSPQPLFCLGFVGLRRLEQNVPLRQRTTFVHLSKANQKSNESDGDMAGRDRKKKGYKFGDISRSISRKFTSSVKEVTGKDNYEFGWG